MKDIKSSIIFKQGFFEEPESVFDFLMTNVTWEEKIRARKTARFGQPNIDSEHTEAYKDFFPIMDKLSERLEPVLGYQPNNCFLNYYENGSSKMGWHGDTTHFLEPETGIAILSTGDTRIFQIRRKAVPTELLTYVLNPGSLLFMPATIQEEWQHAIPKVVSERGRISLTFRKMRVN
jgi:alkylated DNA repair dioxygenase AlkB